MLQTIRPDPDQDLLEALDRRERRSWFLSAATALAEALAIGGAAFVLMHYATGWRLETMVDISMLIFAAAAAALGFRAFSRQ
jgi:hypothetical protein